MKKRFAILLVVLTATLLVISISGCKNVNCQGSIESFVPTISVGGEGRVEAVPDQAVATFGVVSEEESLAEAYSDNTIKMNRVIAAIKRKGIFDKDIRTSSYNVIPVYPRDDSGRQIPGKPVSFRVSQQLTIKIRDISETGTMIDEVISSGVNTFNSLQFSSSRAEDFETEARIISAKNAQEKASVLAETLNASIGKVLRISESSKGVYPVTRMAAQDVMRTGTVPSIEPGTIEITANYDVVFEIIQ